MALITFKMKLELIQDGVKVNEVSNELTYDTTEPGAAERSADEVSEELSLLHIRLVAEQLVKRNSRYAQPAVDV